VEAAERDIRATPAIMVGDAVRTGRRGDVYLDDDEVGCIIEVDRLDVFVVERDLVVVSQVPSERRQTEGREERVLDRAKERTVRLGQRRQDHLDAHGSSIKYFAIQCQSR
jgi:hypothetical protein